MLFVGVMSGTSCDGVDVVLVDFSQGIDVKATQFTAYPDKLKKQLSKVIADEALPISEINQLDAELGHFFGQAVNRLIQNSECSDDPIHAIGLHGQTVCHQPSNENGFNPNTLQIGSAAITAHSTNINTIANFRQMDMAHGGQGAPLAPALHQHLFAQARQHVVVLNLGGIANITSINDNELMGFDTGPANCLLDEWVHHSLGHLYDDSGQWATQGKINHKLLERMLSEPYFELEAPKSTGRELFNLIWLKRKLNGLRVDDVDVQRTLIQLTVETVNDALKSLPKKVDQLVICGGGVHNAFLLKELERKTSVVCQSSQNFGINPDYVEAVLMAWLAKQHVEGNRLNLKKTTGASQSLIYGVEFIA